MPAATAAPGNTGMSTEQSKSTAMSFTNDAFMLMQEGYTIQPIYPEGFNTEEYESNPENRMMRTAMSPLSTFSIDVDTASYSNVRRYLNDGVMPPADAVRTEELINYFSYDLPEPTQDVPFSVTTEISQCPWNPDNSLVMIALQGKHVDHKSLPLSNLVFLLDVSGSMDAPNKLPLLKESFQLLTEQLGENDKVSIVVYAGSSGVVLEGARGDEKEKILEALDRLEAGGSTAGGEGIEKAYEIAKKYYINGGNNRVILATDGDFNVGVSSEGELTRLIEKKRQEGISLSVLGFGTGNIKDNKMEALADKGNGNYAYIDSLFEAKKVLVNEMGATLLTIAKDVKIQVEFNPRKVKEYRLVGYENRMLANEDFDDDTKDAGEIGAGHNVVAFYEIVTYQSGETIDSPELKYQSTDIRQEWENEWMELRVRYKEPDGDISKKIVHPITQQEYKENASENFQFASAVAQFGMLLSESEYQGTTSIGSVKARASKAIGKDSEGYRKSFIELVEIVESLQRKAD
ncbi:MAG: VWA domain-containing protein [Thermoclostridium sp.]|nr:VWA domain-containing protein [Thermoclostridium sp.]